MSFEIKYTGTFKKDLSICQKRHYDIEKLKELIELLQAGCELPQKYRNHQLSGRWRGCFDVHISPDWILIYEYKDVLWLLRTGTHSDLF